MPLTTSHAIRTHFKAIIADTGVTALCVETSRMLHANRTSSTLINIYT